MRAKSAAWMALDLFISKGILKNVELTKKSVTVTGHLLNPTKQRVKPNCIVSSAFAAFPSYLTVKLLFTTIQESILL